MHSEKYKSANYFSFDITDKLMISTSQTEATSCYFFSPKMKNGQKFMFNSFNARPKKCGLRKKCWRQSKQRESGQVYC